jgi:hypothetical protein
MSGNNNTYSPSMNDDEQQKHVQPYRRKWSARIFGYDVPYWIIVLVIVLIVYLIYSKSGKSMTQVKLQGPANDALGSAPTLTSPTSSMNVGAAAASNVTSVASAESTKKLQRELRELFSKY